MNAPSTTSAAYTDHSPGDAKTTENVRIVERFLDALQVQDLDTLEALAADDLVWENVGSPKFKGRSRVMRAIRACEGRLFIEVCIHRIAGAGDTVLVERTDAIVIGRLRMQFWACAVFELRGGRITLWRDYFDYLAFARAALRGLLGVALPSIRRSF
ncbi:limonene-1,2-epoxide hydrolase family protein [Williamsia soli]|uniref:limonene-1,2-epoxide hydrolase family protein n=1 Tax=Williamsia soli TaxID=364929 RepID=UPI001A9FECD9|nr:limonene-1,2-epoxide hydrolase family protein [Williamsia soli]